MAKDEKNLKCWVRVRVCVKRVRHTPRPRSVVGSEDQRDVDPDRSAQGVQLRLFDDFARQTVRFVAPVGMSASGAPMLAVRWAQALEDDGIPAQALVPSNESHPDIEAASRFDDLEAAVSADGAGLTLLLGLPPSPSLSRRVLEQAQRDPHLWLLWERPGYDAETLLAGFNDVAPIDRIVTLSEKRQRQVRRLYPEARVRVLPPAVPPSAFDAYTRRPTTDETAPFVVAIGRPTKEKGITELIPRWAMDGGPSTGLRLLIASPVPFPEGLVSPWVEVRTVGALRERLRLLCAAHAAIFPATSDHLPQALLETMAAGTPVVATAIAGHRDVAIDGRTAIMVPTSLIGLKDAVRTAAEASKLRQRMRKNAHELVRSQYSFTAFAARWRSLFS